GHPLPMCTMFATVAPMPPIGNGEPPPRPLPAPPGIGTSATPAMRRDVSNQLGKPVALMPFLGGDVDVVWDQLPSETCRSLRLGRTGSGTAVGRHYTSQNTSQISGAGSCRAHGLGARG